MKIDAVEENKLIAKQYKELLRVSYRRLSAEDKKQIRVAFNTAVEAHKGQRRKSGEAYIFHPIEVAKIVASEIGMDAISIIVALLHDVVEDTTLTVDDLTSKFNKTISNIIEGLTKIPVLNVTSELSNQAENFKKMLFTMNDDVRTIIIKLADRLHNLRTLDSMSPHKQTKIAFETLFIYAPIAHRIGIYNIKTELEDLGFKYTDRKTYRDIKKKIDKTKSAQQAYIENFSELISNYLKKNNIKFSIKGRPKSIYSIYKKISKQNISFDEIYDKFAIRIIYKAKEKEEKFIAWKIYSVITEYFQPNPMRLRDWITSPKSTGYESLHITVMGPEGRWVEIQIRSERMNEIAERGYASHYKYKHGSQLSEIDNWLDSLQKIFESNNGGAVEFVEEFKMDLYVEEIFVFTPEGDLISLPRNATVIDFAYAVHTQIGNKTRGAKVNKKLSPISKILKTGDQVEIITAKNTKPNINWLNYALTTKAKSKIREELQKSERKYVEEGKEILRRKARVLKLNITEGVINKMLKYFKMKNTFELFYAIKVGNISNLGLKEFANFNKSSFLNLFRKKISNKQDEGSLVIKEEKYNQLVFGKEKDRLPYMISPCCSPIPGDEVFGFTTIREGIKVHKINCTNATALQSNYAYRILPAKWILEQKTPYPVSIKIEGLDDLGLVNKLTNVISNSLNVNMKSMSFDSNEGVFIGKIIVEIKNRLDLQTLLKRLKKIKEIEKITRF